MIRRFWIAGLLLLGACGGGGSATSAPDTGKKLVTVMIESANGARIFRVEIAKAEAEQRRGLMYRTNIPKDGGMLFAPYPPEGGGPRQASFWMKNTPSPLDILYIRVDGTIARIAENTVPYSEQLISSGEPVAAVLEIKGGRSSELGIDEGDSVRWTAN